MSDSVNIEALANDALGRLQGDEVLARFQRRVSGGMIRPATVLDYLGEQRAMAQALLLGIYEMRRWDDGAGRRPAEAPDLSRGSLKIG